MKIDWVFGYWLCAGAMVIGTLITVTRTLRPEERSL